MATPSPTPRIRSRTWPEPQKPSASPSMTARHPLSPPPSSVLSLLWPIFLPLFVDWPRTYASLDNALSRVARLGFSMTAVSPVACFSCMIFWRVACVDALVVVHACSLLLIRLYYVNTPHPPVGGYWNCVQAPVITNNAAVCDS